MRVTHESIPNIQVHGDTTTETLQEDVWTINMGVGICHQNIKDLADTIEQYIEFRLEEYTRTIYKILHDTKRIDIEEDEFMSLLKER